MVILASEPDAMLRKMDMNTGVQPLPQNSHGMELAMDIKRGDI